MGRRGLDDLGRVSEPKDRNVTPVNAWHKHGRLWAVSCFPDSPPQNRFSFSESDGHLNLEKVQPSWHLLSGLSPEGTPAAKQADARCPPPLEPSCAEGGDGWGQCR